jgi:hypothetical protein
MNQEPTGPFQLWARRGKTDEDSPFERRERYYDLDLAIAMGRELLDRGDHCEFKVNDSGGNVVQHECGY